jgi:putative addiction module killer protein
VTPHRRRLLNYETRDGKIPFDEWIRELRDKKGRAIIASRLERFEETGNPGKYRPVGQGIYELKVYFGPGYRVYYGEDGQTVVILLCGGDKSTQSKDIQRAHQYWADYGRRK